MNNYFEPYTAFNSDSEYFVGSCGVVEERTGVLEFSPSLRRDGSYIILQSRLLGLTPSEYLIYLLQNYRVVLYGKNNRYISAHFTDYNECTQHCSLLNSRANTILEVIK